jgi:hypothetical protein
MKLWRLMGFMATGGPAVRGHAWNFLSVSCHHSFVATVRGVVPADNANAAVRSSDPLMGKRLMAFWQWHLTSEHLPVGDVDAADVGEGERRRHRPDDVLGGHE